MKKKSDSKQFKKLVRRRMEKTGETFMVARDHLVTKRITTTELGSVLVGGGWLVPHREIRLKRSADSNQMFRALFGDNWRPPERRCSTCHEWVTHEGYCLCNLDEQPTEITHQITMLPEGCNEEQQTADNELSRALKQWMALPETPAMNPGDCFLAANVGCLVVATDKAAETGLYVLEPFSPQYLTLGTIRLETEDDGWRTYRLPAELGSWAWERVEDAKNGANEFPAFFAMVVVDGDYHIHLASLRP